MARDQLDNVRLIYQYTEVVCALNETRKGSEAITTNGEKTIWALNNTITGVCQLIDALVAEQQRDIVRTGVN
jgi:hypothetical protein